MTINAFTASADICGRRVVLRWTVTPDADGAVPRVVVRRKERDFGLGGEAARYRIYDSGAFPPADADLVAHQLPTTTGVDGEARFTERCVTLVREEAGGSTEVLRRTQRTLVGADRTVLRHEVELLDAGLLEPGRTYYYQLDTVSGPSVALRATATPTGVYRYHHVLYEALPAVYRRSDTQVRPPDAGTGLLPEANASGGQLRRLIDVFGTTVGALRSSADGLRGLRDVDLADARFLPLLAQWIGWDLTSDDIARQRTEIVAAPGRYRTVGTPAGLREIVEHYTGWALRIGEAAQHLAVTNTAPQRNLFAAVPVPTGWAAPDDAAVPLGLLGATGAEIIGTVPEPYPLVDGMRLSLALDGTAPVTVRFHDRDFAAIGTARAAEVAAVIGRAVRGLETGTEDSAVLLRSQRPGGRVQVSGDSVALVSLDGAPGGRLAAVVGADEHLTWLAYAATGPAGAPSRLLVKSHRRGRWYDADPVGDGADPQADPALARSGDRLWCAWVSRPASDASRLRYRLGTPAGPTPARLRGETAGAFRLTAGTTLVVGGSVPPQTFTVDAADFDDLAQARAAEVAAAMNAQLTAVTAGVGGDGALVLSSVALGPEATLHIDLAESTAAWSLGFGDRQLVGRGGWTGTVDWDRAAEVPGVGTGRHADCCAVTEPDGAVRLCWSNHDGARWRLLTTRWTDQVLAATPAGLTVVGPTGVSHVTTADGLLSDDVRGAAAAADGTIWMATAAGFAARRPEGTIETFTQDSTGGALASDDVRGVAIAPDGAVWFATARGAARCSADGSDIRTDDDTAGLPANDVAAVVATIDGAVWAATGRGLAVLRPGDGWQTVADEHDLVSTRTRAVAAGPDGSIWVGTDAGVGCVRPDGTVAWFGLTGLGPGAADVRGLAVVGSTVWVACAAGVVELGTAGGSVLHGPAAGITDVDCRAVADVDGRLWVGTASAVLQQGDDGRFHARADLAGVIGLTGPWSAPAAFDDPGAGEREPHLLADQTGLVLVAARRTRGPDRDSWQLTWRRQDPGTGAWSAAQEVTAPGTTDREPVLVRDPDAGVVVYFRSDRDGGARIWRLDVDDDGLPGDPVQISTGPSADTNPVVLTAPDTRPLLVFRSDRNVALTHLADDPDAPPAPEVSVRRFAGGATVVLGDATRNHGRGAFGDMLDYTPQRPRGDPLTADECYTPGTLLLFVDRGRAEQPLTTADTDRLTRMLAPFLPASVRVVPIVAT